MTFPDARTAVAALAANSATLEDLREIVTSFPALRPVVAAYPGTDESLLEWLRALGDPVVDAQLARRGSGDPSSQAPVARDSPVAQPELAPRVMAPVYTPVSRPRRGIWPVLVAVLGALVLVGGGLGAAIATGLIGGENRSPHASTIPVSTPASPAGSTTGSPPSPSEAPSPSTSPTVQQPSTAPATPSVAGGFSCWDGTSVATLSDCRAPSGKKADWEYLKYAYPSIVTPPDCEKADSTGKSGYSGITLMWECELGKAMIRYRYWEDRGDAARHYEKKFTSETTLASYDVLIGGTKATGWAKTSKETVTGPGGIKRVVVTMWLPDERLSLSVEADTTKALWDAFDVVRIRPIEQSLGHSSAEGPAEAPITVKLH